MFYVNRKVMKSVLENSGRSRWEAKQILARSLFPAQQIVARTGQNTVKIH